MDLRVLVAGLVVTTLAVPAGGATVLVRDPGAYDAVRTEVDRTSTLTIDGHALGYDGSEVSRVLVSIENDGSQFDANVTARLHDRYGEIVVEATEVDTLLVLGENSVTIELPRTVSPTQFARIEIRVSS